MSAPSSSYVSPFELDRRINRLIGAILDETDSTQRETLRAEIYHLTSQRARQLMPHFPRISRRRRLILR